MKKSQWITICAAILLTAGLYAATYGNIVGDKKPAYPSAPGSEPGHAAHADHGKEISIDTILTHAREHLTTEQSTRIALLEQSITRGDVQNQKIAIYKQLARFWEDSVKHPDIAAWYLGESARLENSENSLTFAARKFLELLREEAQEPLRQWEAVQAEALYKRALELNPNNDSTRIGLAATMLYGGTTPPMQAIGAIREIADRDSTNVYAQMTLGEASLMSNQTDKALARFERVARLQPKNLQAVLISGDLSEKLGKKQEAIGWYSRLIPLISESSELNKEQQAEFRKEVEARIAELKK